MEPIRIEEKIYIVKSANEIIGPFSIKEIIDQIWNKQLTAFDEIKTPFTRWSFIRDDEALGKVFKEIAEQRSNSEDTADLTATIERTAFTISNKLMQLKESHSLQVEDAEASISDYRKDAETAQIYSSSGNVITIKPAYSKKSRSYFKSLYFVLLIASLVILGSLLLNNQNNVAKLSVNSNYWDRANYLGDYQKVMSVYDANSKYNIDSVYKFIDAFIASDKFLEAEGIINLNFSDNLPLKDRAKLMNYKGLIELHRQNFKEANDLFLKALELDPTFEEAQLNLVDGYLLLDDIAKAKSYLLEDVKLENAQATAVFLKYETIFFDTKFKPEDNLWINDLLHHVSAPYDQRQEILFLLSLILLEHDFISESTQIFQRALDVEPFYFFNNIQNQALYHPKVVVPKTLVLLKRFEYKHGNNPYYLAAISLLYFKSRSPILARKYLDQALKINPLDQFLLGLQSLFEQKFAESEITEKIISGQLSLLEAKLASKYCYEINSLKCADDLWNYLLAIDPNSIEAISGKVDLMIKKNHLPEAKKWLHRGLGLAPRYIPLREIEMEHAL